MVLAWLLGTLVLISSLSFSNLVILGKDQTVTFIELHQDIKGLPVWYQLSLLVFLCLNVSKIGAFTSLEETKSIVKKSEYQV